jgi:hypothetical protein
LWLSARGDTCPGMAAVRVRLVTPELELLNAAIYDRAALAHALDCELAENSEVFPDALGQARDAVAAGSASVRWGPRLVLLVNETRARGMGRFQGSAARWSGRDPLVATTPPSRDSYRNGRHRPGRNEDQGSQGSRRTPCRRCLRWVGSRSPRGRGQTLEAHADARAAPEPGDRDLLAGLADPGAAQLAGLVLVGAARPAFGRGMLALGFPVVAPYNPAQQPTVIVARVAADRAARQQLGVQVEHDRVAPDVPARVHAARRVEPRVGELVEQILRERTRLRLAQVDGLDLAQRRWSDQPRGSRLSSITGRPYRRASPLPVLVGVGLRRVGIKAMSSQLSGSLRPRPPWTRCPAGAQPHAQRSPPYVSGPAFKMRPGCSAAESASAGPSCRTTG